MCREKLRAKIRYFFKMMMKASPRQTPLHRGKWKRFTGKQPPRSRARCGKGHVGFRDLASQHTTCQDHFSSGIFSSDIFSSADFGPQFFVSHFFVLQFFVLLIFVWQFKVWVFFRLNYFSSVPSFVCPFFRSYIFSFVHFFVRIFFRPYIFSFVYFFYFLLFIIYILLFNVN